MHRSVAFRAQRDQILFLVAARLAAELEVMHLQILHASAILAAPAVALQHLPMQFAIAGGVESQSWVLGEIFFTRPAQRPQIERLPVERRAGICSSVK